MTILVKNGIIVLEIKKNGEEMRKLLATLTLTLALTSTQAIVPHGVGHYYFILSKGVFPEMKNPEMLRHQNKFRDWSYTQSNVVEPKDEDGRRIDRAIRWNARETYMFKKVQAYCGFYYYSVLEASGRKLSKSEYFKLASKSIRPKCDAFAKDYAMAEHVVYKRYITCSLSKNKPMGFSKSCVDKWNDDRYKMQKGLSNKHNLFYLWSI